VANYDFRPDFFQGSSGLDSLLSTESQLLSPVGQKVAKAASAKPRRIRVASLSQLAPFTRVASGTLIHKSTQDFWSIKADNGNYYIERLVNDEGPVKE
jgi:hypothetical protein